MKQTPRAIVIEIRGTRRQVAKADAKVRETLRRAANKTSIYEWGQGPTPASALFAINIQIHHTIVRWWQWRPRSTVMMIGVAA